jgi:ubiquitin carboxyl-terminal hydrolase L3
MPLESNPEVINEFIGKIGLKTELFSFQELLSLEEWGLEMIPKPVLGIMMLYE